METSPNSAFKTNLEPDGTETRRGAWSWAGYADLVSERRYRLYRLKASHLERVDPGMVGFRLASVVAIAPSACTDVVEWSLAEGRLDMLAPRVDALDEQTGFDAETLIRFLVDALARFEESAFCCAGVTQETVGVDESGGFVLLPPAYALPPACNAAVHDRSLDTDGCLSRVDVMRRTHVRAVAAVARFALGAGDIGGAAGERLRAAVERVDGDELRSVAEFGAEALGDAPATTHEDDARTTAFLEAARGAAREATDTGGIVEIHGPSGSGKTRALEAVRTLFMGEGPAARFLAAWDFADRPKRKLSSREGPWSCDVWLVDDLEDQRIIRAQILEFAKGRGSERPTLVYTLDSDRADDESRAFVTALAAAAGPVRAIVAGGTADGAASRAALDETGEAERRLIELLCVADQPLPYDVVASMFSRGNGDFLAVLHRLAGRNVIGIDYRPVPPTNRVSVALCVPSAAARRGVRARLESESPDRLRNLHRTVARMAESSRAFPGIFVYEHLVAGGQRDEAARYAVAFLRETTADQRAPFLATFEDAILSGHLLDVLPYGDRLFGYYRVASDLFALGRRADAERVLVEADAIDVHDDGLDANAALISQMRSLLADTWSARGNYTQALDLLDDTREWLTPHLTLAEQAQLMNEIGWVQYRLGDYEGSVNSCRLSLNTLNANDHPLVVAQALNLMGVIHFNTSRYDEAISYYEQAAILRENEGAHNALSGSYNNLALAYQAKAEYDKALDYHEKSLDIKRRVNNQTGIAGVYLNQALMYLDMHDFDAAEKRCRDSLEISTRLGMAQLSAETHYTLGDIESRRGHLEEAERYYLDAIEIASSLETINEEMGARRRLASLYLTMERLDDAREHIGKAETLGRQIGSRYENALIAGVVGDLCVAEERDAEAIDHYERAAAGFAVVSKHRLAATAFANIGMAHARGANTFEARHYLDRALDIIKSEIGHQIPPEIVTLQQALHERPVRTSVNATQTQKLLYAFYELSSLSEFADDKTGFFKRVNSVFRDLTGAHACLIAMQAGEGEFVALLEGGEQQPIVDHGLRALFTRSLQLGALVHSRSSEVADLVDHIALPWQAARGESDDNGTAGFICVPMKAMGHNLGCALLSVSTATLPPGKEEANFISSIGRHVAGDLRLTLHLEEHTHKEKTLETEFETLKAQVADRYRFENLIGKDESMKKIFRIVDRVKDMDTGILIIGESGTGKTQLARAIHYNSPRHKRPFQQIHCAEIPATLLESELFGHERGAFTGAVQRKLGRCEVADGGTVFLDDVNTMTADVQAKLLHYLENKSFMRVGGTQKIRTDVRIVAASNEDLEQLVKENRFREDLYYRLKVIQLDLPPLRERPEDILAIAQEFITRRCQERGKTLRTLSSETIKLLQMHPWKGNVRELQNVLEQVLLLTDDEIIEPSSLPDDFLQRATGGTGRRARKTLETLAKQMVESQGYSEANPLMPQLEALLAAEMAEHVKSKTRAASLLGITKPTLYNRIRNHEKLS